MSPLDARCGEVGYVPCSTMSEVVAKIPVLVEDDDNSGISQPLD